jgi:dihydroorotase
MRGRPAPSTIDGFGTYVILTQRTPVFAFINIGSPGLPHLAGGHSSKPEYCNLDGTVRAFERHGDWLVGVKMLASQSHAGSFGIEALKLARKAAELVDKPLMVHIGNAPPVVDEVLDLLRPGDIVTHAYHGKIGGVLGYGDRVLPAFRAAVDRGVIVDLGHGRASFSFRTCEIALAQGMPVHCISTDLHRGNLNRYAVSLARTMSKLRALGLSLMEVVRAVTLAPARAIRIDDRGFGSLQTGQHCARHAVPRARRTLGARGFGGRHTRVAPARIETVGVLVGEAWYARSAPL